MKIHLLNKNPAIIQHQESSIPVSTREARQVYPTIEDRQAVSSRNSKPLHREHRAPQRTTEFNHRFSILRFFQDANLSQSIIQYPASSIQYPVSRIKYPCFDSRSEQHHFLLIRIPAATPAAPAAIIDVTDGHSILGGFFNVLIYSFIKSS